MKEVALGSVCEINPPTPRGLDPTALCSFVPMGAVDDYLGAITSPTIRTVAEVADGSYTYFADGDVLFAKITPCMENGKCALAKNLVSGTGFGSTEFHVLRAKTVMLPEWIYFYLRQESTRRRAERSMTGSAGQKRVPRRFLEETLVLLPPLPEQQRIAAMLERADRLRRLRRYALELSEGYLQAVFLAVFGDPVRNPMGWVQVKLSEIGKLDRGRSKHRPRNAPGLYGGTYPFVQTGDIANASGYVKTFRQTYSVAGLKQSKVWPSGTLCITIAANIAKTAILTFDACFPDSVVGFAPNGRTNTEFIQHWFSFIQKRLEETAPESAQKNINLEILRDLDVPLPPLRLQQEFARIVLKHERLRSQQREALRQAEQLFGALLGRAFRGEL